MMIAFGVGLTVPPAHALKIRSRDKSVVGEFQRVFGPQSPAVQENPQFVPDPGLLSGMAWPGHPTEWYRNYSMISPIHFIGAAHYLPDPSWKIRLLGTDGQIRDYAVKSTKVVTNELGQATDLFIGTLKEKVDAGAIEPFSVFNPSNGVFAGREALVFGKVAEGMTRSLDGEWMLQNEPGFDTTRFLYFDYDPNGSDPKDIHYQGGDSGSPAFVLEEGEPALVGVASSLDEVGPVLRSSMSMVPAYLDQIDSILEAEGYHARRAVIPEGLVWEPAVAATMDLIQGKPGAVEVCLSNSNPSMLHNLVVTVSGSSAPDQVSGKGWITEKQSDGSWSCRRGGLPSGQSTALSAVWNSIPASLSVDGSVAADGIGAASFSPSLSVESTPQLNAPPESSLLDSDLDGVSDELEHALGGDPQSASLRNLVGAPLLPTWEGFESGHRFCFTRRQSAFQTGEFYLLESSGDLAGWSGALPVGTSVVTADFDPAWPGFEKVEVRLPCSFPEAFYRLRYQAID